MEPRTHKGLQVIASSCVERGGCACPGPANVPAAHSSPGLENLQGGTRLGRGGVQGPGRSKRCYLPIWTWIVGPGPDQAQRGESPHTRHV